MTGLFALLLLPPLPTTAAAFLLLPVELAKLPVERDRGMDPFTNEFLLNEEPFALVEEGNAGKSLERFCI